MFDQSTTAACPSNDRPALPAGLPRADGQAVRIGDCEVHPDARALFREGRQVEIGSRAFDLLIVLLRARGTVVTKAHILRHVWPATVVEESNLRFQMVALRKALGNDQAMIKTVHGRGYVLVAESAPVHAIPPAPSLPRATGVHQLGNSVVFVIEQGRDIRDALFQLLRPLDAEAFAP